MTENEKSFNMRKWIIFVFIWIILFVLYFTSLESSNFFSLIFSFLIILPIWYFGDKTHKKARIDTMFIRIKKFRPTYKIRSIISGFIFIIFFISSFNNILSNIKEDKKEREQQVFLQEKKEAYDKVPAPIIEIISKEGNVGENTGYKLIYKTENATIVEVVFNKETKIFSGNSDENSIDVSLDGTGNNMLNISIVAKNNYKTTERKIVIERNKNKEEIRIEKEEKERLKKEAEQTNITVLDGYIKELKEGYNFYDVATISATVYRFNGLGDLIEPYLEGDSINVVQKAKEAKNKLINTQKTIFPKLRSTWCGLTKDTMRRLNIDVKCSGTTISFIGGVFASNANIEDSYLAISDMLKLLRFKQARFYRYKGSEYTYYTISSLSDGALE